MAAIFQLPGITAGERWRGGLRAEAGAQTTAGGVFFSPLFSCWTFIITVIHVYRTLHPMLSIIFTLPFNT